MFNSKNKRDKNVITKSTYIPYIIRAKNRLHRREQGYIHHWRQLDHRSKHRRCIVQFALWTHVACCHVHPNDGYTERKQRGQVLCRSLPARWSAGLSQERAQHLHRCFWWPGGTVGLLPVLPLAIPTMTDRLMCSGERELKMFHCFKMIAPSLHYDPLLH